MNKLVDIKGGREMKGAVIPYLTFYSDGNEAAEFYANVLGLEVLRNQKYSDADFLHPPEAANYLIHCHLKKGDFQIMLADSAEMRPEGHYSGVSLVIHCESAEEAEKLYADFSEEGKVLMELQDTFWGAKYGKVKDKFGYTWDFNFE